MIINNTAFAELSLAKSKEPRYTIELAFQENAETGTAQAGTANTITLAADEAAVDDFYTNMVIEITGGTGEGQKRTITDYVGATKIATVGEDWDVNLLKYSEDLTQSAWTKTGMTAAAASDESGPEVNGVDLAVTRLTITSAADPFVPQSYNTGSNISGRTFTFTFWVKGEGNSVGKTFRMFQYGATGTENPTSQAFTITAGWQFCEFTKTFTTGLSSTSVVFRPDYEGGSVGDTFILTGGYAIEAASAGTYVKTTSVPCLGPDSTSTYRIDDLYFLTSHPQADSAIITGAPVIYDVIRDVSGTTQQLYPDEARATIGAMSFDVIDKSINITTKVYTKLADGYGLKGKRARLYMGFDGLTFSEYELRWTQIVDSVSFDSGAYAVRCADVNRSVRKDIFDLKTTNLSASIDGSQSLIPVYSVTGFTAVAHGTSYSDAPSSTVGYIKIDKEIIRWTSTTTDATLGLCFVADQRGALNTQAVAHTIAANAAQDRKTKVEEYVYLEMPAPKLAYAILTGTIYGQGATLPANWHLGISTDYVRLADFTGIGSDWWNTANDSVGFNVRFEGLKKQDAKAFLEKEVYLLMGAFSPVYADGALGLKRMTGVTSGAAYVMKLDTSNVVSHGALQHDMARVMNNILIEWNWEDSEQRFTRSNLLIDSNSISTHGTAKLARLKFKGLHGSRHSYSALTNRFNVLRDRYAGPPLRLDVRVMPSLDVLEVGDIVRVTLSTVRDYSTGTTLDRAFEVQGVRTNWITGEVSLTLFGSSQAATVITPDSTGASQSGTATPPLSDAWYSSAGTSLVAYLAANYPANYTNVGGILTITGNVTLPGNATISESMAYYYAGDITINAGVIVTSTHNLYLKAKGHVTNNGTITLQGAGLTGTATTSGQPGFLGTTIPGGSIGARFFQAGSVQIWAFLGHPAAPATVGTHQVVPPFDLSTDGGTLSGIPTDLRGTSGGKGGNIYDLDTGGVYATGGAGGAGGGGFLAVCRGWSSGAAGVIDLDGAAGTVGGTYDFVAVGNTAYAGTGAGGAPGACVILLDGSAANLPDLGAPLSSVSGATSIPGNQLDPGTLYTIGMGGTTTSGQAPPWDIYSSFAGAGSYDYGQSGYRIHYLPENTIASEDVDQPLPDVTNFSAAPNGGVVVFKWSQVSDPRLAGYDIRFAALGISNWDLATPLTRETKGTQVTSAALPPGSWTVMIKALSRDAIYSTNPATQNVTVTNVNDIIYNVEQAPDWLGSISADGMGDKLLMETGDVLLLEDGDYLMLETAQNTFVRHWTGVLVPNSQNAASTDTVFDSFVPNPYTTCLYTSAEIDTSFDADVRIWGDFSGYLGPGETGTVDWDLYVDHHTTAGSYDGFETWTIGEKNTRYVQHRMQVDTTVGVIAVESFVPVVDVQERTEHGTQIVAAGGTTLTFADPFHTAPTVEVTAQGSSALIATHETPTTTSVRLHVFNTGGSDVGGTVSYKITGA